MRHIGSIAGLLPLLAPYAYAGHIFGALRESGQPVRGAEVVVTCGPNRYPSKTESDGSYRLFAKETTRCSLQVNYKGQSPRAEIFSYNEPTRYDFDLVWEQGRLTLRRR
ncbi:MAG: carboxypeptidase regulatory-like domain-containing protein [Acidobacteria bacterium]|nr:carboxypeptidase regulatory-like domain-containing protein [Acidobacteriota bacterium]